MRSSCCCWPTPRPLATLSPRRSALARRTYYLQGLGLRHELKQGVALLGWSYFWYPASDAEKANRTAWVDAYTQQLDPLRHGNQIPAGPGGGRRDG